MARSVHARFFFSENKFISYRSRSNEIGGQVTPSVKKKMSSPLPAPNCLHSIGYILNLCVNGSLLSITTFPKNSQCLPFMVSDYSMRLSYFSYFC